ncbi:hypothetical protein NPIL_671901 [Nephila pilipes]|uniref:Uncharacterized protein n=1 Tax=Nephila pilipes TaxID=299642 RepID=A0A8X6NU91_NEPPI|nr:hypothetical protein NPIL_671901 [Nephila pilipes]
MTPRASGATWLSSPGGVFFFCHPPLLSIKSDPTEDSELAWRMKMIERIKCLGYLSSPFLDRGNLFYDAFEESWFLVGIKVIPGY